MSYFHHTFRLLRRKEVKTNNNYCQTGRESHRKDNVSEKKSNGLLRHQSGHCNMQGPKDLVPGGIIFTFVRI